VTKEDDHGDKVTVRRIQPQAADLAVGGEGDPKGHAVIDGIVRTRLQIDPELARRAGGGNCRSVGSAAMSRIRSRTAYPGTASKAITQRIRSRLEAFLSETSIVSDS
jgi:hypothetical protein